MRSITYKIISLIFLSVLLSGCVSRLFSVGEELSYCQEYGCDYTDVGVCANPLEILENKDDLSEIRERNKETEDAKVWF